MEIAKKFSGSRLRILLNYYQIIEPYVVAAIYEKHNISIFKNFSDSTHLYFPVQLLNFYEKNPQATTYFILDTMFFLCL